MLYRVYVAATLNGLTATICEVSDAGLSKASSARVKFKLRTLRTFVVSLPST